MWKQARELAGKGVKATSSAPATATSRKKAIEDVIAHESKEQRAKRLVGYTYSVIIAVITARRLIEERSDPAKPSFDSAKVLKYIDKLKAVCELLDIVPLFMYLCR